MIIALGVGFLCGAAALRHPRYRLAVALYVLASVGLSVANADAGGLLGDVFLGTGFALMAFGITLGFMALLPWRQANGSETAVPAGQPSKVPGHRR